MVQREGVVVGWGHIKEGDEWCGGKEKLLGLGHMTEGDDGAEGMSNCWGWVT